VTSNKQVQANRRNALKSTGPKTQEGKDVARYNAVKHGLLSQEVLLPDEDEAAFRELGERLRAELQPAGELEGMLVDRIIAAYWRLRRLGRVEAGIFAWELYMELTRRAYQEAQSYTRQESPNKELLRSRLPTTKITDEQRYKEALSKAKEMERMRDAETATLGKAFIRDADKANAFSKLSRYEATLERSLYKALHELQRLQAARRAHGDVPPPVAVDVQISSGSE
jgi:hypothetical protein